MVLMLSGAVMFLDGFDTQAISFAAPVVAREWNLPVAALGPILSAAIVGLMVGYLVLAPLASRVGHRRMVIWCTAIFGILSLVTAAAAEPLHLIVLRFLTGAGLGAVIPSVVSLTSEFAPKRRRSSLVMYIYCFYALGFVAAGLVSGMVIPSFGWRTLFLVGGVLPLLLLILLIRYLPESPTYLLSRPGGAIRAFTTLQQLDNQLRPGVRIVANVESSALKPARSPVVELFRRSWFTKTLLLWLAFAANLAAFYAIQGWLPTILVRLGQPPELVIGATVLTTAGGIVAATVIGPCMDRISPFRTLGIVYVVGAVFVGLLGVVVGEGPALLMVVAFVSGGCVAGGQMSVIALATVLYPPKMRSTGVGWALGIGRLGGIAGPLLVGAALGAGAGVREVFFVLGVVLVAAAASVFRLGRQRVS